MREREDRSSEVFSSGGEDGLLRLVRPVCRWCFRRAFGEGGSSLGSVSSGSGFGFSRSGSFEKATRPSLSSPTVLSTMIAAANSRI